jgi:hypothetical protein
MDVGVVMAHLQKLVQQGIRHVYLAVDAISPRFLNAFADVLLETKLDLDWSCQFFLTKSFDRRLVSKLAESGLRTASFGLESGSSRILEAMGKGSRRVEDVLEPAFDAFRASPIGLQPLFFFGFPGENDEDRRRTVNLLIEHRDIFATISKGGLFDLLPGSIVARNPARFGIQNVRRHAEDDIAGCLDYELASGEPKPCCNAFADENDRLPYVDIFERPWAGGIDTLHTQLYVEHGGRDVFKRVYPGGRTRAVAPHQVSLTSSFDLDRILQNVAIAEVMRRSTAACELLSQDLTAGVSTVLAPLARSEQQESYCIELVPYREP